MQSQTTLPDAATSEHQVLIRAIEDLCLEKMAIRVEGVDTDLFATGVLDSMTLVQLIVHIEQRFGVTLPMEELSIESFRSVRAIAGLLAGRRCSAAEGAA